MTPPSRRRRRERRHRARQVRQIHERFYGADPGLYLTIRSAQFALVAGYDERHVQRLQEPIRIDQSSAQLTLEPERSEEEWPSWDQRYAAIEGQALVVHGAETLMRWLHSHDDRCVESPWIRMAETTFATFKPWVKKKVLRAPDSDVDALIDRCFFLPQEGRNEARRRVASWLREFARVTLEADAHNATKHGLAIDGGLSQTKIEIGDVATIEVEGAEVTYLRKIEAVGGRRKWVTSSTMSNSDLVLPVVEVAARLIGGIRSRGAHRYLGEPPYELEPIPDRLEIFAAVGQQHLELIRTDLDVFVAPGGRRDLSIMTGHIRAVTPPADDG